MIETERLLLRRLSTADVDGLLDLYSDPVVGATSTRGQGFATEAGAAAFTWGFENLDVPYLTAMIRPDNKPSLRVAARLGLRRLREDGLGEDHVIVHAVRPCLPRVAAAVTSVLERREQGA